MGVIATAIRNALPLQAQGPLTDDRIVEYLTGPPSAAGVRVNAERVLGIPAAYACVRLLAESVASLPLCVFERLEPRGRRRAVEHPVYSLLHHEPNPFMSAFQLREVWMTHLLLWGNAFAEVALGGRGEPVALYPLRPDRMDRPVLSQAGTLLYPYILPDGGQVLLPQRRVLHLRGLSDDGIWGYAPVTVAREAFGQALATQEYASRFFGNSATPSGVLQAKTRLSEDAAKRLREDWQRLHQGLSNAQRIAVLEEGVTWQAISMPHADAQFLESRQFSVAEIARLFRVPPHMIGDVERSTSWGTGIEQQTIGFISYSLVPWLTRTEQELHRTLFLARERERYYPRHVIAGLLRGDMQARKEFYAAGRQWGWLSADDVRELEEMDPLPEGRGEVYLQPANMVEAPAMGGGDDRDDAG